MEQIQKNKLMQLFQYTYEDNELSVFIEHCAALLEHPIWIMDEAFNILECSKAAYDIWMKDFLGGEAINELVPEWDQDVLFQNNENKREPVYHYCKRLNEEVVVSDICVNRERVAKFTAFIKEKGTVDLEFIKHICSGISLMIQKLNYLSRKEGMEAQLLHRLLQEPGLTETQLQNYLSRGNLSYQKVHTMQVYCIKSSDTQMLETMDFYLERLSRMLPHCTAIKYNEYGICLMKEQMPCELVKKFSDFLINHHLICGVSNPFQAIQQFKEYFIQAEFTVLSIQAGKNTHFCNYSEVYVEHLIIAAGKQMNLRTMCVPKLLDIIQYDRKNGTYFYETLVMVYNQTSNREAAAKALNVHVNTIKYRLTQIEEIFGYKVESGKEKLDLLVTAEILRYYRDNPNVNEIV